MSRIYVASLSDYNAGLLHGCWIDVDGLDADDIEAEVRDMLRESKYPNVMVDCPDCDGPASVRDLADAAYHSCDTCKGSGKVPSAEEWAIHDYELGGIKISESESFETVAFHARMLDEHGDAWAAYVSNIGDDATEEGFSDAYIGQFDSLTAWAEDYADDTGMLESIPENLRYYFDFEAYGRDAQLGGDIWRDDSTGHTFYNR